MKFFLLLVALLSTQLSFSKTLSEEVICTMSYSDIKEFEKELDKAKEELSLLKDGHIAKAGASLVNLVAAGFMLKTPDTQIRNGFLVYAILTSAAAYYDFKMTKQNIKTAEETITLINKEIAEAFRLKESGCKNLTSVDEDDYDVTRRIVEVQKAIANLKAIQVNITESVDDARGAFKIKMSGSVIMGLGVASIFATANSGSANIGGGLLVMLGAALNTIGDGSNIIYSYMSKSDLEDHQVKFTEQLKILQELLDSLKVMKELSRKYN